MGKKVRPVPKGYSTVSASLVATDAKALIKFCKKAFGGKLRGLIEGPDGKVMHAEVKIGDSIVMISDAVREPARPGNLFLYVDKVDKTFGKALKAGAKAVTPVEDMFWGDRYGRVEDAFGNRWGIATHVEDVSEKQLRKRMAQMQPPA
jgi:uncharacterized glyoxalase superfamily protein PhnB